MRISLCAILLAILLQSASAATAGGHAGLALAALVAGYSPTLSWREKRVMAQLFDGRGGASPSAKKINVAADKIVCKAGDVDIAARSCALTFGAKTVNIGGRRANELFATLIEADVPFGVALGTMDESVEHLACVIDPTEISENASGGGALCDFTPGQ